MIHVFNIFYTRSKVSIGLVKKMLEKNRCIDMNVNFSIFIKNLFRDPNHIYSIC